MNSRLLILNKKSILNFLQTIKVQIQPELLSIVKQTSQLVVTAINSLGTSETPVHPLLELVELIFKQFKLVATAHSMLLKNYLSVTQRYAITAKPYDIVDYWSQAQAVVCDLKSTELRI